MRPGQAARRPTPLPPPFGSLLKTISGTFSAPGSISGSYTDSVYSDPTNTFGAGDLDFVLMVTNSGSSPDVIGRITGSSFTGFKTDVGYAAVSGGIAPSTVDRLTADDVGFDFATGVTPGGTTDWLVIKTNAKLYTSGTVSLIDSIPTSVAGLAPTVPEPSTWAMLGLGFAGVGLLGFAKRRRDSRYAL